MTHKITIQREVQNEENSLKGKPYTRSTGTVTVLAKLLGNPMITLMKHKQSLINMLKC